MPLSFFAAFTPLIMRGNSQIMKGEGLYVETDKKGQAF